MSDKSPKRPAHEVILNRIEKGVQSLARMPQTTSNTLLTLARVDALCLVLREMVIPEKEREMVLAELQRIAAMWRPDIAGLNLVEDLRVILSR